MTASDDELFVRFAIGRDTAGLAEVYERAAPELRRAAARLTGAGQAADDLVQATFLVAIESAQRYDPKRAVRPWLAAILGKLARLAHRRQRRQLALDRLPQRPARTPEGDTLARELAQHVEHALAAVPPTYRRVLQLYLQHGLGADEIARTLSRRPSTVRTQLVRGLEHLRRRLPPGLAPLMVAIALSRGASAARRLTATFAPAPFGMLGWFTGTMLMKKTLAVVGVLILALTLAWSWPEGKGATDPVARQDPGATLSTSQSMAPAPEVKLQRSVATATGADRHVDALTTALMVRVVRAADQAPQRGVAVELYPCNGREHGRQRQLAVTDARGEVEWNALDAGSWRVRLLRDPPQTVELRAGAHESVTLTCTSTLTLGGHVVDAYDTSVPEADIWVGLETATNRDVPTWLATKTDAEGRFALAAVDAGQWVHARKPGYAPSTQFRLRPDHSTSNLRLQLGRGDAVLRGHVTCLDEPVAHARLELLRPRANQTPHPDGFTRPYGPLGSEADAQGRFELTGLAPGAVDLLVDAEECAPTKVTVELALGIVHDLAIALTPGVSLTGIVRRADGRPIAAAEVITSQLKSLCATTGPDGAFRLTGLVAGQIDLYAHAVGFCGTRRQLNVDEANGTCDLTLEPLVALHGRVVDETGDGLPDFVVRGRRAPGQPGAKAAADGGRVDAALRSGVRCQADGRFALPVLPQQDYLLSLHEHGHALSIQRPEPYRGGGASEVLFVIRDDERSTATLKGRVLDAAKRPVAFAWLQLHDGKTLATAGLTIGGSRTTDADGRFVIDRLPPRTYRLHVNPREAAPSLVREAVELLPLQTLDLGELRIPAGVRLTMTARDARLVPSSGATVQLESIPPGRSAILVFDARGEGSRTVPPGRYQLVLHGEGFRQIRREIVLEGAEQALDLITQQAVRRTVLVVLPQVETQGTARLRGPDGEVDIASSLDDSWRRQSWSPHLIVGDYVAELDCQNGRRYQARFHVASLAPSDDVITLPFEPVR